MKKILLLCLVALMVGCTPKDIKFMSFNIRNSSPWTINEDGENAWGNRREAVANMILKEIPDALGLQEALPDQTDYLDSVLAGEYVRIGVGRDDGDRGGESMCIYYRPESLTLIDWHTEWLSPTPDSVSRGWDAACIRTLTFAHFHLKKQSRKEIIYINTHLDHVGQEARRNSVLQLCNISKNNKLPVIIGGDMNSTLDDTIFLPFKENNLISARDLAEVTDSASTYNAFGKAKASQIDHFFVRGWKEVKEFRTLTDDYGAPYLSDHYPIVTIVGL